MKQYDMRFLLDMVQKTYLVDESGDVCVMAYTDDLVLGGEFKGDVSLHDHFVNFLVWANGPDWETWLPNAQVGQIPPR